MLCCCWVIVIATTGILVAAITNRGNYTKSTRSRNGTKPIPYVSKAKVIIKKKHEEPLSRSICPIAHQESSGRRSFGLQYEGKLSCILLAHVKSDTFMYIHSPFNDIDGMTANDAKFIDTFAGFATSYSTGANNTSLLSSYRRSKITLKDDALQQWLHHASSNKNSKMCNRKIVYMLDNCWQHLFSYYSDEHYRTLFAEGKSMLHSTYFASSKPHTGFDRKRPNVVVHIQKEERNIDASQTEFYFDNAVSYYNRTLSRPLEGIYPLFWVETDDPNWGVVKQWQRKHPNDFRVNDHDDVLPSAFVTSSTTPSTAPDSSSSGLFGADDFTATSARPPSSATTSATLSSALPTWKALVKAHNVTKTAQRLMITFHRMVMADGIVMSTTSLSNAAAMLNNATAPLLVPGKATRGETSSSSSHDDWYKTAKFLSAVFRH